MKICGLRPKPAASYTHERINAKPAYAKASAGEVNENHEINLFFKKALPEPDFRYFSKANALYLFSKQMITFN